MKRQEPLPLLVWVGAKHGARPVNYLNLLSAYGWSWRKRKEWALEAQRPNTGIANTWHTWPQHVSPTTGSMAGCPAFTWDFPTLPSTRIQAPAEADLGPCYMASLDSHAVTVVFHVKYAFFGSSTCSATTMVPLKDLTQIPVLSETSPDSQRIGMGAAVRD